MLASIARRETLTDTCPRSTEGGAAVCVPRDKHKQLLDSSDKCDQNCVGLVKETLVLYFDQEAPLEFWSQAGSSADL